MNALILHPTASTPVPVTLVATKAKRAKKAKPKLEPTLADLRQMVAARGIKVTTKHTKGELLAMFSLGVYIRPAAYDRAAAKRQAAKA
jgi:hypothetical protein